MYRSSLAFSLILFFLAGACAQNKQDPQLPTKIDDLVQAKYPSLAPGCAVLAARGGQVIYKKAYGKANLELNTLMKPEMVFRIGSVTKQYTAIAILQLMEQGKLSPQDSIQQFIKGFPYKGHTITIENLLTHTSGIIGYDALDAKIPFILRMDLPPTRIIDTLKKQPLQFTPGSRFNYSNSNYYLLGYIIEIITGLTYKEYLQKNIFTPAGLTNTYYDDPNLVIPNRVSGYINDDGKYRNAGYLSMSLVYAAGALVSNVEDLFKWHQALYSYKLVKKETLEKAFTTYTLSGGQQSEYGYGWFIKDFEGNKVIAHGGAIDGFKAMELYIPGHDIYVATLFNSENDASIHLATEIADIVLGKPAVKEVVVSESVLDSYAGTYQYAGSDPNIKVTVTIYKKNGKLYADLSNGTGSNMALLAQSDTRFILPDIKRITTTVDFIIKNGKVVGQIWTQETKTEFKKID